MKVHLVNFSLGGTTKITVRNIAKGMGDLDVVEHDMLVKANDRRSSAWAGTTL